MARRRRLLTRGHAIAWAVSLCAGIGFVAALGALPAGLDAVVSLVCSLVGIFGVAIGIGIATGWLARLLSMGYWPRSSPSSASSGADLPADRVFGLCVILFALPSLFVR